VLLFLFVLLGSLNVGKTVFGNPCYSVRQSQFLPVGGGGVVGGGGDSGWMMDVVVSMQGQLE
jgi:hypothetical protein